MSVTIHIAIPDHLLPVLEQRARGVGLERDEYVSAVLSRELSVPPTLDEVLAGFREQVAMSGLSDRELDQLFRAAREEASTQNNI